MLGNKLLCRLVSTIQIAIEVVVPFDDLWVIALIEELLPIIRYRELESTIRLDCAVKRLESIAH